MRFMRQNSYVSRLPSPIALTLLCTILTACAGRPGAETLEPIDLTGYQPKRIERLYVATTRQREAPDETVFTNRRSAQTAYASFDVSIPPNHVASNIEWPKGRTVNPRTDFAVVQRATLDRQGFLKGLTAEFGEDDRIGVFVHGYNYSFQEALFRLAQLKTDSNIADATVLFSWPSVATVPGYLADKESATFSRDALTGLMVDLVARRHGQPVDILAHSMGGWLTVEALRQLKLEGRQDVLDNLRVILAAPDIDVDVFSTQLTVIGRMRHPITILVSPDDRALEVSSLLSAGRPRAGAIDVKDPVVMAAAKQYGVQIIDISSIDPLDVANHNRFAEVASLAGVLSSQTAAPDLGDAGAFVFDAAAQTISTPFSLAATVLRGR